MFTGLVEEVGQLLEVNPSPGGGAKIKVGASRILEDIALGDSIAVNGTCLTAVEWSCSANWILFDAVRETLTQTTLAHLASNAPVNLERALAVGARVGGHYVTGHVDGQGKLSSIQPEGNGTVYRFSMNAELARLIAPKGSVAIDGISLTVVDASQSEFSVWIVPHTSKATNLSQLKLGSSVNLEADILAKYVARMVCNQGHGGTVNMNKLQEAGFLS